MQSSADREATGHRYVINPARLAALERTNRSVAAIAPDAKPRRIVPEPSPFPPLELVTRTHVGTAEAAYHLNRKEQTMRGWKCNGTYPPELRPIIVNGRLNWPVAGIKAVLGVA